MYLHLRKDLSQDDLAEIYCKLLECGWDDRLGDKPEGFDQMPSIEKHPIVFPLVLQIERLVPHYKLTRTRMPFRWMSDTEYDEWYLTNKVEPMLDEWYSCNERRDPRGNEAKDPPKKNKKYLKQTFMFLGAYIIGLLMKLGFDASMLLKN